MMTDADEKPLITPRVIEIVTERIRVGINGKEADYLAPVAPKKEWTRAFRNVSSIEAMGK